jgi:hypothetical protein
MASEFKTLWAESIALEFGLKADLILKRPEYLLEQLASGTYAGRKSPKKGDGDEQLQLSGAQLQMLLVLFLSFFNSHPNADMLQPDLLEKEIKQHIHKVDGQLGDRFKKTVDDAISKAVKSKPSAKAKQPKSKPTK